jgi:hypothetical protein
MSMEDDKSKHDGRDRSKIAAAQEFEVEHFAQKYDITSVQARELIAKHGNNRVSLEHAVARLRDQVRLSSRNQERNPDGRRSNQRA